MPDLYLPGVRFNPARGYRKGAWRPRPVEKVVANIWHTTGAGPVRRHLANPVRFPTSFDAAEHVYARLMKAGPHFLVGQQGQLVQMAPLDVGAWHVGRNKSWGYFHSDGVWGKRYQWWRDRWNGWGVATPLDLADGQLWNGRQCNPNVYGIEVAPPEKNPWGEWSPLAWERIAELTHALEIPNDAYHQLGHADAHPRSRTNKRGIGWDPPEAAWDPWNHVLRTR